MTIALTTHDSELDALRARLAERLQALRGRVRARLWLDVAVRIVLVLVTLAIISFTLDWCFELSRPARITYLALAGGLAVWTAITSVLAVVRLRLGPIELAAELDKTRRLPPSEWITPRVATVLQLSDPRQREPGFSAPMVQRAVQQSSRTLDSVDFARQLDEQHLRRCLALLAAALIVPLILTVMLPSTISSLWIRRWFLGSNVGWPRDTALEVLGLRDGRLFVPRGEPVSVRLTAHDKRASTEMVWIRITPSDAAAETSTMVKFGMGDFRFELPAQQQPVLAEFWGGDGRAGPVEIMPIDRPRIAHLSLVHKHPRDRSPQTYTFTGEEGNLRLLKLTAAELTLTSSVPVSSFDVSADGGVPPKFERVDDRTFRAKWVHQGPIQMRVGMVGRDSQLASRPQPIGIGFQEDRAPRITLTHSGVGTRVTPMAIIPLKIAVRDDFAVAATSLAFKVTPNTSAAEKQEGTRKNTGDLPPVVLYDGKTPPPEPTFDAGRDWDLESLNLIPGDALSAQALATDDCYTGAQTARSRTLLFRVVPPTELFREILIKQQQLRARMRRATEQAEALRESSRTAAFPNDADDLLRRHNLIQREVWQVLHGMQDSSTEMRLNRLGGRETFDIISRTVIDPLAQLHDDLLTRQRQALEGVRQPSPETPEQVLGRQQEIVGAMQKILKNMAQWDSFIDVVNQLNEVIKLESAVREKTEEMKKKQFDSIFDAK